MIIIIRFVEPMLEKKEEIHIILFILKKLKLGL